MTREERFKINLRILLFSLILAAAAAVCTVYAQPPFSVIPAPGKPAAAAGSKPRPRSEPGPAPDGSAGREYGSAIKALTGSVKARKQSGCPGGPGALCPPGPPTPEKPGDSLAGDKKRAAGRNYTLSLSYAPGLNRNPRPGRNLTGGKKPAPRRFQAALPAAGKPEPAGKKPSAAGERHSQNTCWPEGLSPVTWSCLRDTSRRFNLPPALLLVVMDTEAGTVGRNSGNDNGSFDMGPMQINSLWLPVLAGMGLDERLVRDNGCVNLAVGAWILRSHLKRSGNLETALADYHSRNPERGRKYLQAAKARARRLDVTRTFRRANRGK
jgi:hypothetical protein